MMSQLISKASRCEHHAEAQIGSADRDPRDRQFFNLLEQDMEIVALDEVCSLICGYRAMLVDLQGGRVIYFE